jgi:hypothetical protein
VLGVADVFAGVDADENGHGSRASLHRPQCGSFCLGLNTSSTRRFKAYFTGLRCGDRIPMSRL